MRSIWKMRRWLAIAGAVMGLLTLPGAADAGMASPRALVLHTVTKGRLHIISFFVVLTLIVALLVQLLWNFLRRDFPKLPRLGYLRALVLVVLWAALFMLVLVMISALAN